MPVRNYDNTLVGEYIRAIENPDSIGWNPYLNGWMEPEGSAFDHNNRGMGVDVAYNPDALKVTQGNNHFILSEQDERDLRNSFIRDSYNYKDRRDWENNISGPLSSRKEIEAMGLIYRGDGAKLYDKRTTLGKAYRSGSEEEFHQAVNDYYKTRKVSQRAKNNDAFWNSKQRPYPTMTAPKTILNTTMAERMEQQDTKAPWQKADGGSLKRKKWDDLSMMEKSEMMGVAVKNGLYRLDDIRKAYNEFAEGGDTNEPQISDSQYYSIMEKVAHDNWQRWGDASEDAALERILNDNSYDYRGYYANNPQGQADANTHWPDAYKTYWHPTFSTDSKYSDKVSQFNPTGATGGSWIGETYFPADAYHQAERFGRKFGGGPTGNVLGIQVPKAVEIGASFLPFVGSAMDVKQAYEEPTVGNIASAALSVGADLSGLSLVRGLTKAGKVAKAIKTAQKEMKAADKANDAKRWNNAYRKLEQAERSKALDMEVADEMLPFLMKGFPMVADWGNNANQQFHLDELRSKKKANGGNLFDEGGDTQQTIYRTSDGRYVLANDEEVTPLSTIGDDVSQWSYVGSDGRIYSPHRAVDQGSVTEINPFSRQAQGLRDERWLNERQNNATFLTDGLYSAIRNWREGRTPMQALQGVGLMPAYDSDNVAGIGDLSFFNRSKAGDALVRRIRQQVDKAEAYKNSPQYRALVQRASEESESMGTGAFPLSTFEIARSKPHIVLEERKPGHVGSHIIATNTISIDPYQADGFLDNVAYHEGLHHQGVGKPDPYIGDNYQKWLDGILKGEESFTDKLAFVSSPEEYRLYAARNNADDYLRKKVSQALKGEDFDKEGYDYLTKPGELQVNGLEAGQALGIEPFTPMPTLSEAFDAMQKAQNYNTYLQGVKDDVNREDITRFWNLLTGQYTPALLPVGWGLGLGLDTATTNKKDND